MRFLLGLILGAAMVLVLAEGAAGRGNWEASLHAARDYLQHKARSWRPGPQEAGPQETTGSGSATVVLQAASAPSRAQPVDAPDPAEEPIPRPPDPRPVDVAGEDAAERTGPEPQGAAGNEVAREDAAAEDIAGAAGAAESVQYPPAPQSSPKPGFQPVWVPFHSEMSASGFAARLTETLDHPFRVERHGPGRYQVVFAYTNEPERQTLLDRAAEATGLPL